MRRGAGCCKIRGGTRRDRYQGSAIAGACAGASMHCGDVTVPMPERRCTFEEWLRRVGGRRPRGVAGRMRGVWDSGSAKKLARFGGRERRARTRCTQ